MNGFDPGEGWRMEQFPDEVPPDTVAYREEDGSWSYWVREVPVPPLPTEPYTVIRVTWRDPDYLAGSHIYTLSSDRYWVPQNRHVDFLRSAELVRLITGFEVLAEPRAVTAKAVLRRVLDTIAGHVPLGFELRPDGTEDAESAAFVAGLQAAWGDVNGIAREFGAGS